MCVRVCVHPYDVIGSSGGRGSLFDLREEREGEGDVCRLGGPCYVY